MTALDKFNDKKQWENLTKDDIQELHGIFTKQGQAAPFNFLSDDGCKQKIAGSTWHALTDELTKEDKNINKLAMLALIFYRRDYVNALLAKCAGNTKWAGKSVGSFDLTSDYDITITAADGQDVEILARFNDAVAQEFKMQPGTCFDTNVYVKDYAKVTDNLNKVTLYEDTDVVREAGDEVSDQDQDIAALTKHRRFSDQTNWDQFEARVCDGVGKTLTSLVKVQYDSADGNYQIAIADLLVAIESELVAQGRKSVDNADATKKLVGSVGPIGPLYRRFPNAVAAPGLEAACKAVVDGKPLTDKMMGDALHDAQHLNCQLLVEIQTQFSDLVLKVSNRLYVERMRKARILQAVSDQNAQTRAEIKLEVGLAIFFASEAYHSEGAVQDIVMGSQEKIPQKKAEAREKLQPVHLLESFNEQYGDYLKDFEHYVAAKKSSGYTYYRCSKYISRLLAVLNDALGKKGFNNPEVKKLDAASSLKVDAAKFKDAIDKLVRLRKGEDNPPNKEDLAQEYMRVVGVTSPQDLTKKLTDLAVAFNVAMRSDIGPSIYNPKPSAK